MELAVLGTILLGARLLDAGIDPGWAGWPIACRAMPCWRLRCCLSPWVLSPCSIRRTMGRAWLLGSLALTYLGFRASTVVAYQAWGPILASISALRPG